MSNNKRSCQTEKQLQTRINVYNFFWKLAENGFNFKYRNYGQNNISLILQKHGEKIHSASQLNVREAFVFVDSFYGIHKAILETDEEKALFKDALALHDKKYSDLQEKYLI